MSERHLVQLIDNDLSSRLTKWRALWKVQMALSEPCPGRAGLYIHDFRKKKHCRCGGGPPTPLAELDETKWIHPCL